MLPEISRRCSTCGASIRERDALFCPECGKSMPTVSKAAEESAQSAPPPPADEVVNATEADESVTPPQPNESANAKNGSEAQSVSEQSAQSSAPTQKPQQPTQPVPASAKRESSPQDHRATDQKNVAARAHPGMAERTRETLHRASTVARGVIEDEVKRVEKIRHVSSVVIEEASYDPSLRFVLVALVLFIIFIILLVLSKVMG